MSSELSKEEAIVAAAYKAAANGNTWDYCARWAKSVLEQAPPGIRSALSGGGGGDTDSYVIPPSPVVRCDVAMTRAAYDALESRLAAAEKERRDTRGVPMDPNARGAESEVVERAMLARDQSGFGWNAARLSDLRVACERLGEIRAAPPQQQATTPVIKRELPSVTNDGDKHILTMKSTIDECALKWAASEDAAIRASLVKLGWTPPEAAAEKGRDALSARVEVLSGNLADAVEKYASQELELLSARSEVEALKGKLGAPKHAQADDGRGGDATAWRDECLRAEKRAEEERSVYVKLARELAAAYRFALALEAARERALLKEAK